MLSFSIKSVLSFTAMALGLTQPLTEMIPRDKGVLYVGLTTLPLSCANCREILGVSTSWSPKGL